MNENTLHRNLATMEQDSDITIIEGVMGLFDGASDGSASSAEVTKMDYLLFFVLMCGGKVNQYLLL